MKKLIGSFFLFFLAAGLSAQEINVTAQKLPKEASFAQPFDVHLEIAHTPGYALYLDPDSFPKDFELISEKTQTLSPGTASYDLTFMPFTLGVSTFTAVSVKLLDHTQTPVAQTNTQETHITVKPVKLFDQQTMQDIRPPYIPKGWLWWLLCAALIGLIIYFVRHFYRRVQQTVAAAQAKDNRPPDVIALSKIQMLLQSGLWENAQYKVFYIELSDILREYFWRRFQLDTSADTSVELLRRLRKEPLCAPLIAPLREYLASSDLVKFAKVIPDETIMQRDVKTVQYVIRQTTPVPAPSPSQNQEAHV